MGKITRIDHLSRVLTSGRLEVPIPDQGLKAAPGAFLIDSMDRLRFNVLPTGDGCKAVDEGLAPAGGTDETEKE